MPRIALAAFALSLLAPAIVAQQPAPPVATKIAKVDTLHGDVRVDNYFWLRKKSNPKVIEYLDSENAYTASGMKHTEALQSTLYSEMLSRIKETDVSVPHRNGAYWYYSRTEQGKSYPILCRKRGSLNAKEEIYLDENALAAGKKFFSVSEFEVSPDGNRLAYLQDTTALRVYTLYVKDLGTGRMLADTLGQIVPGLAWANDNHTLFYLTADSARRSNAVWRHELGDPKSKDVRVYEDDDVLNNVGLARSKSGNFVLIADAGYTSSEWSVIPTASPATAPKVVAPRKPNVEYTIDHVPGAFLMVTNDGARNFKIVRIPETNFSPSGWTEWQPVSDSVFVEYVEPFKDYVVVGERSGGLAHLRVTSLATKAAHDVTFPEPAYGVFPSDNAEWNTKTLRFVYSSFLTPASTYDYDMASRERVLKKRVDVPGYDASRYKVIRLMVPVRDGVRVPVSMLVRNDWAQDGSHPLLEYAYGSYGITTEATFNSPVLSLVDRGFAFAIAHVRGGQEMGRQWYDEGKMMKKKNTFNDFVDVAEYLEKEKYTSADRMIANGGSAGGLLMGAVSNMRPDLFRAIVADVPFVDVINTMMDASIPLTAEEWQQWGDPHIKAQYDYMKTYSPYDNVEHKNYPWMLVTSSLNDSQVGYWEPTKWVAKLRATKADTNPLFFKINMAGGHGGSSGRYDRLHEIAFRDAFMLDAVGLAGQPVPVQ
jgi:oligopeptidase B